MVSHEDIERSIYQHLQDIDETMYLEGMDRDQLQGLWFEPSISPVRIKETSSSQDVRVSLQVLVIAPYNPRSFNFYDPTRLVQKIENKLREPLPILDIEEVNLGCLDIEDDVSTTKYGQPDPAVKLLQTTVEVTYIGSFENNG